MPKSFFIKNLFKNLSKAFKFGIVIISFSPTLELYELLSIPRMGGSSVLSHHTWLLNQKAFGKKGNSLSTSCG